MQRQGRWLALLLVLLGLLVGCAGDDSRAARPTAEPTAITAAQDGAAAPSSAQPPDAATDTPLPATAAPTPTPTPPAPLAAVVNGQYIFLADYEQRVAQYEQALLDQGINPDTGEGQALLEQARQDVLEGLIDGVLIEQGSANLGIAIDEAELESRLEADIEAGGGQAAFEEWLGATGQTRDRYKELLRQSLLAQRAMEAVTAAVPAEAEQVHVRHIVVEDGAAAEALLDQLENGADFVELARTHSIDVATRDNGGDLGWFPRGLVAPELENTAFALQPGQLSEVIQLGEGYHIIQVLEREASYPLSSEMQIELRRALFEEWLDTLRVSAEIERLVAE